MIEYKFHCLWNRWLSEEHCEPTSLVEGDSLWFLNFFYQNRDLMILLYKHDLLNLVYDFSIHIFTTTQNTSNENKYIVSFLTYGFLGILTECTKSNFAESTETMIHLVEKFYVK